MRSTSRHGWWVFCAGALLGLAALGWASTAVLSLEGREQRGRQARERAATTRLALWRMDSWLAPQIARESARPYYEYESYFSQTEAYTRLLSRIGEGEVLSPSPLLTFEADWVRLHFQISPEGTWSSPQLPTGNLRDLAESTGLTAERLQRAQAWLAELERAVSGPKMRSMACIAEVELAESLDVDDPGRQLAQAESETGNEEWVQRRERDLRKQNYIPEAQLLNMAPEPGSAPSAGGLAPIWVATPAGPELCMARTLDMGSRQWLQGFWIDWPVLREQLLAQVADLVDGARLTPKLDEGELDLERALGGLPVYLELPDAPLQSVPGWTPVRAALAGTWLAALLAIGAVGVALRTALAFGEKSHRFASAVTHELRTPLTTFQMYSEMLAKGMVRDEARQREYLETLESESHRLSHLVENVLAYARLEDGRGALQLERVSWRSLAERVLPDLERRAREAAMDWSTAVEIDDDAHVETDAEALRQILFNLVDNACKYGRGGDRDAIELSARASGAQWIFRVRDAGCGVPAAARDSIFAPFDRGGRDPADKSAGIGLGLALARGLARDLGGDLSLVAGEGAGASFELTLPRAA